MTYNRLTGVDCPIHELPTVVTQSGLQHVCVQSDCDFHVRLQGPERRETMSKEKTVTIPINADKKAREKAIAEAVENGKKKKAAAPAPEPVKPKKAKPEPEKPAEDDDMMSVSDVARALGIDPKRARARLRAAGQEATEGRWEKVKRGSKAYQALVAILAPPTAKAAKKKDADDDEEEESDDEEEEDE